MQKQRIELDGVAAFEIGDVLEIHTPRPPLWRLLALWRWYKTPTLWTVTDSGANSVEVSATHNTGEGR